MHFIQGKDYNEPFPVAVHTATGNPEGRSPSGYHNAKWYKNHPEAIRPTPHRVEVKIKTFRERAWGFVEGSYFSNGVGFVLLALGALLSLNYLMMVAWVFFMIGAYRAGLFNHQKAHYRVASGVAIPVVLGGLLFLLWEGAQRLHATNGHRAEPPTATTASAPPSIPPETKTTLTEQDIQRLADAVAKRMPQLGATQGNPPVLAGKIIPGYLQLDRREFVFGNATLEVGKSLHENLHFVNHGMTPVRDAHLWPMLTYVDVKANGPDSDIKMQKLWNKAIDVAWNRWKNSGGQAIGVGQEMWQTAVSEPLTQLELDGLANGDGKLYVLATAVWRENRKRKDWLVCEWTTNLTFPAALNSAAWHYCDM